MALNCLAEHILWRKMIANRHARLTDRGFLGNRTDTYTQRRWESVCPARLRVVQQRGQAIPFMGGRSSPSHDRPILSQCRGAAAANGGMVRARFRALSRCSLFSERTAQRELRFSLLWRGSGIERLLLVRGGDGSLSRPSLACNARFGSASQHAAFQRLCSETCDLIAALGRWERIVQSFCAVFSAFGLVG